MKQPRASRVPEKVVQQQGVALLRIVGARVWVLGTKRRRGEIDHGTRQTPGIPDVFAFVPRKSGAGHGYEALWWEAKAKGGRLRPQQGEFQRFCLDSPCAHVVGGLDNLIAWLIARGLVKPENVPHYRLPAEMRP